MGHTGRAGFGFKVPWENAAKGKKFFRGAALWYGNDSDNYRLSVTLVGLVCQDALLLVRLSIDLNCSTVFDTYAYICYFKKKKRNGEKEKDKLQHFATFKSSLPHIHIAQNAVKTQSVVVLSARTYYKVVNILLFLLLTDSNCVLCGFGTSSLSLQTIHLVCFVPIHLWFTASHFNDI